MKIQIELQGVKVEKEIPTKWKEVTFGQFLKLAEAGDDIVKIISLFTEIDEETLRKAKIYNLESLIELLGFLRTEMNLEIPETCIGYKIPKNLEFETIGQYQDLKAEAMTIKDVQSFDKYALFCAIYATSPYDYKKAEEISKDFLNAPSVEVLAIGNFTLAKLAELTTGIKVKSLLPSIPKKKFWLVLTVWVKSLVFIKRYYTWRKKLHSIGRSS
jgi:hypothetical protein